MEYIYIYTPHIFFIHSSVNGHLGCIHVYIVGFPGGSDGKAFTHNEGDPGLIPVSGRSPGEGNGNPLQYSCLENSMDRGAWWATVHGVTKSQTQLSDFTLFLFLCIYCI